MDNKNPIFQGFNEVKWTERKVIKYLNDIYSIKINWRMAKALIEDDKKLNTIVYEDRIYNDIEELANLSYSIVLLDYIKIGRINRIEVESLELREYTKTKLDVNLVIARADNSIYLDIILSEINIVDDKIYKELLQDKYEGEYGKSVVDYMYDGNNKNRKYRSIRDISQVVWGKIDSYVLKVTDDKFKTLKKIQGVEKIIFDVQDEEEKMRNTMKIINSNFIYNI